MKTAMTVEGKLDLFGQGDQAKMYQEFRPVYTDAVVAEVMSRVPESRRHLYVDIACGSGQLTHQVAPFFKKAIGIDPSFEQLKNVPTSPDSHVDYRPGSVFALPLEDDSVDLITVAQGLHWLLPYDKAFAEIMRVLKPGGVFVAVGYGFPQIVSPGSAMRFANKLYVDILGGKKSPGEPGCWWETNRPTIDCHYSDIAFPFPESVVRKVIPVKVTLSVSHYCNYLRTLSAYRTLVRSGTNDPMPDIESEINRESHKGTIDLQIPFFTVSCVKS